MIRNSCWRGFMYPATPRPPIIKSRVYLHRFLARERKRNRLKRDYRAYTSDSEAIENVTGVTVHGWMLLDRVKWLWRKLPATSAFSL